MGKRGGGRRGRRGKRKHLFDLAQRMEGGGHLIKSRLLGNLFGREIDRYLQEKCEKENEKGIGKKEKRVGKWKQKKGKKRKGENK